MVIFNSYVKLPESTTPVARDECTGGSAWTSDSETPDDDAWWQRGLSEHVALEKRIVINHKIFGYPGVRQTKPTGDEFSFLWEAAIKRSSSSFFFLEYMSVGNWKVLLQVQFGSPVIIVSHSKRCHTDYNNDYYDGADGDADAGADADAAADDADADAVADAVADADADADDDDDYHYYYYYH